jgi:hypothetical protein
LGADLSGELEPRGTCLTDKFVLLQAYRSPANTRRLSSRARHTRLQSYAHGPRLLDPIWPIDQVTWPSCANRLPLISISRCTDNTPPPILRTSLTPSMCQGELLLHYCFILPCGQFRSHIRLFDQHLGNLYFSLPAHPIGEHSFWDMIYCSRSWQDQRNRGVRTHQLLKL